MKKRMGDRSGDGRVAHDDCPLEGSLRRRLEASRPARLPCHYSLVKSLMLTSFVALMCGFRSLAHLKHPHPAFPFPVEQSGSSGDHLDGAHSRGAIPVPSTAWFAAAAAAAAEATDAVFAIAAAAAAATTAAALSRGAIVIFRRSGRGGSDVIWNLPSRRRAAFILTQLHGRLGRR